MDLTKKDFFDLDWIGARPTEEPFVLIVQITTVGLFLRLFYFDFFQVGIVVLFAFCFLAHYLHIKGAALGR